LGKKISEMGKRLIKVPAVFRTNHKGKIMCAWGQKTFSKEINLQGNLEEVMSLECDEIAHSRCDQRAWESQAELLRKGSHRKERWDTEP